MNEIDLHDAVYRAAGRPDVRQAVKTVYDDLQQQIDSRKPLCHASGRCCRFEAFGHRLYVTTIELAAFVYEVETGSFQRAPGWDGKGCLFQVGGLCSVHGIRPFGCRIFFCDGASTDWQSEQYELFHSRIKRLHETLGVPYLYVEWRWALGELGLSGSPAG